MIGPVVGTAKRTLFESADVVVVPSYAESFCVVVAEALAHGVPVIASRGTPWRRVEEIGCGLWVENDPDSLAKAIQQMSRMALDGLGRRGQVWAKLKISGEAVASEMIKLYGGLSGGHSICD